MKTNMANQPDPLGRIKDPKMRKAARDSLKRHRQALDMLAKLLPRKRRYQSSFYSPRQHSVATNEK